MSYPLDPKVALRQIDTISSSAGVEFAPIQNGLMMLGVQISVWNQWLKLHSYVNGDFRAADGRPRSGYAETLKYADKATYETAYDNLTTAMGTSFTHLKEILNLLS